MTRRFPPCWLWLLIAAAPVTTTSTAPVTMPSTTQIGATTQENGHGPNTVMLRELQSLYQPVPFDHKTHARMAEMWDGCTTCHHRSPTSQPTTTPAGAMAIDHTDQNQASKVPACRSCHEISVEDVESIDIRMPTLKGAYHRQCLNCHREWANANSCNACHQPLKPALAQSPAPTPDDIVGRMHPPIPEPDIKQYKARFEPAMGSNVLFRHKEHAEAFGLRCVNCHRRDSCSSCHADKAQVDGGPRLLHPGRTWQQTHGPCVSCHQQDRCRTCHYEDGQTPPPPFDHAMTGQVLDKDHANLECGQCHEVLKVQTVVTCGEASCHKPGRQIAYPAQRPGPIVTTLPVVAAAQPSTAPSTRPIVEIRTGPTGTVKRVRHAAAQE